MIITTLLIVMLNSLVSSIWISNPGSTRKKSRSWSSLL